MNNTTKTIVIALIAIIALLVVVRACQKTKEVKIKQRSGERKSELSVEIEKVKEKKTQDKDNY